MPRSKKNRRVKKATPIAKIHSERLKAIKKHVIASEFNLSTKYGKRKLKAAYDYLEPLIKQPNKTYKSRSRKKLGIAARSVSGHAPKYLRSVPVPTGGVDDAEITVEDGQLKISTDFWDQEFIEFSKWHLARGKGEYVRSLLSRYSPRDAFKVKCGAYEIEDIFTRDLIPDYIGELMDRYAPGKVKPGQSYNYWLNGVIRLETKNQVSVKELRKRNADAHKKKKASYKEYNKKARKAGLKGKKTRK
jgi:hypothetical protein